MCGALCTILQSKAMRNAYTSKVELFVIIVNGWKPLTIITKSSTLDVAAVLHPPLGTSIVTTYNSIITILPGLLKQKLQKQQ